MLKNKNTWSGTFSLNSKSLLRFQSSLSETQEQKFTEESNGALLNELLEFERLYNSFIYYKYNDPSSSNLHHLKTKLDSFYKEVDEKKLELFRRILEIEPEDDQPKDPNRLINEEEEEEKRKKFTEEFRQENRNKIIKWIDESKDSSSPALDESRERPAVSSPEEAGERPEFLGLEDAEVRNGCTQMLFKKITQCFQLKKAGDSIENPSQRPEISFSFRRIAQNQSSRFNNSSR